ncbi:putative condensin complex subunit 2/barren [Helianthus annuus]|nr:putative condensin complex subunit 2/barren [Helianthus annuus]
MLVSMVLCSLGFLINALDIASCTLEAGVRIYSMRVDSVHSEAYKVLGGISRVAQDAEQEKKKKKKTNRIIFFLLSCLFNGGSRNFFLWAHFSRC